MDFQIYSFFFFLIERVWRRVRYPYATAQTIPCTFVTFEASYVSRGKIHTWTVGHSVKVAVGQHEMLRATFGLQAHHDVGDTVIEAGEAAEEVDGEGAGGPLHIHAKLKMRAHLSHRADFFDLLQQVVHRQHFILVAADRPRSHADDAFQVLPECREMLSSFPGSIKKWIDS